ncbi:MAG TPA: ABC transporter substrate-binding protein [Candidatus Limnocylindria bacterium]|nr:ABC transporter substrate-binding protein [Candidatus Limnocylindria bacterium]
MNFKSVRSFAVGSFLLASIADLAAQTPEKVLITHSSESISLTPLLYGMERGLYRKEGIDLQFRVLRGELAVSSIVAGKDVDYLYGAGTAFFAAVRGVPMRVLSHDFKSVFFYLMGNPRVQSGQDLKGKRVAVASLAGTGAAATRASLKAIGVDPDRDVTLIVIGAASVRMAAMETGSVEAAIMPVPWNFRMKQKGFKELIYAGKVMSQPLTGLATSKEKVEKQPDQARRMLRAFLRSMKAMREDRKAVTEFIAKKFSLDGPTADETYKIMIQTLTDDGTIAEADLQQLLDDALQETGVKRPIAVKDIVDYSILRRAAKEIGG